MVLVGKGRNGVDIGQLHSYVPGARIKVPLSLAFIPFNSSSKFKMRSFQHRAATDSAEERAMGHNLINMNRK